MNEVLVTMGANGALGSFIQAFVNPGDEVVIFEPTFPMYLDHIQFAGGKLKTVPLTVDADGEWVFDPEILKSALSDKTTLLILNTPHNPTGKCFTLDELEEITDIVKQYPKLTVLADEVYDFLTFDGARHIPFASLSDNWNRTVTIYSGGKLMNATGWKVGWAIAHP
jgi:N-succinyldiaminopimelate aminotransferase